MSKIKEIIKKLFYKFFCSFPVVNNRVLIFSYYGEHYSGSPKYISEYISNDNSLNIVWAFVDKTKKIPNCKTIKYGGIMYFYNLATAGTIITNYRQTSEFKRRNNQKYIQTWHSSLRLKMIEKDAETTLLPEYVEMAKNDSKQITHLISGSKKSSEIFERSFWYKGDIISTGTPQCDLFFNDKIITEYTSKVREYYNISDNKTIVLYAPTFRKGYTTDAYLKEFSQLKKAFDKGLNVDTVFLIRLHPHMINMTDLIEYNDYVIQATDYDDPQELLCASDVLISDYSAIMFDYMVTRKPCFLYVPDLEEYVKNDRNLYFDINQLPFVVSKSYNEILDNAISFDFDNYQKKIGEFLLQIGSYDDGKACERIKDIIKGEYNG